MGDPRRRLVAVVGTRVPVAQVGSVTRLVGAAGGLGGFLPPIVMGLVYQATGDYAIGLMLLSDVALPGLDRLAPGQRRRVPRRLRSH